MAWATIFWIGVAIVFATHLYMLLYGFPATAMRPHAWVNLAAGVFIVLGSKLGRELLGI